MNDCYLLKTGAFLPGEPITNDHIQNFLGRCFGENWIKEKILRLNGITTRHYALDSDQQETFDLYGLAREAVEMCLRANKEVEVEYLAAGSTNTPIVAPGLSSRLHDFLSKSGLLSRPLEINSNAGICSSGAQAFVNAVRAVKTGDVDTALAVGVEQPSAILKASVFWPTFDLLTMYRSIKNSKWFMSVFLRFMLSDGAGAFLLGTRPNKGALSFRINWTHSRSFANEAPLCMQLSSRKLLLSQDVRILSSHMVPCSRKVLLDAFEKHNDQLGSYKVILPHMSSYYFESGVKKIIRELSKGKTPVPYWTNLKTAGNTGSASIYIMLDEFVRNNPVTAGDKILLFVPESGQFNYVVISLTAVEGT